MSFGEELVRIREDREIGRKKLAEQSKLSLSYLHYIENDRVLPGPANLRKIARAINKVRPDNKVNASELIRMRDRVELERMGLEGNKADLTLLLRESGPLDDDQRAKIERTIARVLADRAGKGRNRKAS